MSKERYFNNAIKGFIIAILFVVLALNTYHSLAQTRMPGSNRTYEDNVGTARVMLDSIDIADQKYFLNHRYDSLRGATKPLYVGYALNLGYVFYTLDSDIPELNNLGVPSIGATAGGIIASQTVELKANAGLYYSDDSTPYTFDLVTGNLSASLYLLRVGQSKYHTLEPYVIGGVSLQQIKFYGTYLNKVSHQNLSTSEEQLLGKTVTTQLNAGLGVEYQLENDHGNFIHLVAEVTYGVPVAVRSTREAFDRTNTVNPVSMSVGISFGKIKQRSK